MVISRSVFLSMRNVSEENCRGNHNTHFMFKNFFFPENHAIYETMWKNIIEPGGLQLGIWHMRIACCIPKATNTDLEYVTHYFSTATKLKSLNVTLHVRSLPVLFSSTFRRDQRTSHGRFVVLGLGSARTV